MRPALRRLCTAGSPSSHRAGSVRIPAGRAAAVVALALGAVACGSTSTAPPATQSSSTAASSQAVAKPIFGVDYSPYTQAGQQPGSSVPDSQITAELTALKGRVQWVKINGGGEGNANLPKLAHDLGFKVAAIAFLSSDPNASKAAVAALEKNVNAGYVDMAIVGSETVAANQLKAAQVVAYMNQVRADIGGKVPVTTVEPDKFMLDNPSLISASDVVMANITPFSYKVALSASIPYMQQHYSAMVAAAHGKKVYIGESEWATDGGPFGDAVASPENAAKYFGDVENWARSNDVGLFYFEAFDEPWLQTADSRFGPHWGIFTSDRTLKPGFDAAFQ